MFGKKKAAAPTCDRGHEQEESWEHCPFCAAENADAPPEPEKPAAPTEPEAPVSEEPGDGAVVVTRKSAPRRPLAGWLVVLEGEDPERDYRVHEGRNVLGKGASCDVSLKDAQASERHAVLVIRDGRATVEDLDSRHGTRLDGKAVSDTRVLPDGGRLAIGSTELVYRSFPRS